MALEGAGMKNNTSSVKTENITYTVMGKKYHAFVAYNENLKGKRPAVIVVHEWWGLNSYPKMRAEKLAEQGYLAMAVDLFGDGKTAANPAEAQALTAPFYAHPEMEKELMDAAILQIKKFPETDPNNVFAIGYCFGGSVVLNAAKLGVPFKGVVSFHGGLKGVPAKKELLKAKILVCHGGADKFVSPEDVANFKQQLDAIGAHYKFVVYPGATHAFTNPASDENARKFNMPIAYNPKADKESWNEMLKFLKENTGK